MKIFTSCTKCLREHNDIISRGTGNLVEEGWIEYECEHHHKSFIEVQEFKFEILFYEALKHYVQKEYEASVFLFANSLEKFYEFFIKMYVRKLTSEDKFIDETLMKTINRAENQLGAFRVLYFIIFKKNSPKLPNALVEFRNNVIHNGKIVSEEECFKYGEAVFSLIRSTILEINLQDKDIITNEIFKRNELVYTLAKQKSICLDGVMTNYISFTSHDLTDTTFSSLIQSVREMEKSFLPEAIQLQNIAILAHKKMEKEVLRLLNIYLRTDEAKEKFHIDFNQKQFDIKIIRYHYKNLMHYFYIEISFDDTKIHATVEFFNSNISIKKIDEIL